MGLPIQRMAYSLMIFQRTLSVFADKVGLENYCYQHISYTRENTLKLSRAGIFLKVYIIFTTNE